MNFYYKKKMTAARATSSSDGQVLLLPFVGSPSFPTTPTNNSSSSASCSPIPVPLPQPPPCTPSCGTDAGTCDIYSSFFCMCDDVVHIFARKVADS